MIEIAILLLCAFIVHSTKLEDDRKKWFDRITKYELIHINLDAFLSTNIIQFDAFGDHFKVQLTVNEDASPILLHPNADGTGTYNEQHPSDGDHCYYHGKVLGDEKSRVAISGCEGEGFRGRIHAFGYKLFINPTNYYYAPYDDSALSDEHLVYKSSDYNGEEVQAEWGSLEAEQIPQFAQLEAHSLNLNDSGSTRRRLGSAGKVELVTVIDGTWVKHLGSASATIKFFRGVVNDASELYTDNNLPYDLRVSIYYSYAILDDVSGCTRFDISGCLDTSQDYFKRIRSNYKYDYGFMFVALNSGSGKSFAAGTCIPRIEDMGYNVGAGSQSDDRSRMAKILAHELGHCVMLASGSSHDSSPGWIMDAGGSGDTWSTKSIQQMRKHKDRGGWKCFQTTDIRSSSVANGDYSDKRSGGGGSSYNGGSSYGSGGSSSYGSGGSSSYGSGGSSSYGSGGNSNYGSGSSSSGSDCVKFYNFPGSLRGLNGYWSKSGSKYYQDGNSWRSIDKPSSAWRVNGAYTMGWCTESDLLSCSGRWKSRDYSNVGSIRTSSSCSNALNAHPECFDEYENAMCLYGDGFEGESFALVEDEGCFNDAPVWRLVDDDADKMYYLHYSNTGEWIVSDGELSESSAVVVCQREDISNCTEGSWLKEVDYDDVVQLEVVDDVYIVACGVAKEAEDGKASTTSAVTVVVVVLLVIVLAICGFFVYQQHRTKRLKTINSNMIAEESEAEEEEEIDVEVETNLTGA